MTVQGEQQEQGTWQGNRDMIQGEGGGGRKHPGEASPGSRKSQLAKEVKSWRTTHRKRGGQVASDRDKRSKAGSRRNWRGFSTVGTHGK